MMPQVLRVEQIEVRWSNILSKICHQAKNLYNRANFLIKEYLKKTNFSTIMTLIISSKRKLLPSPSCSYCSTNSQTPYTKLERILPSTKGMEEGS